MPDRQPDLLKETSDADEPDELAFDEALLQLEGLAERLEEGDLPLERALELYERAVGLFTHCRGRLSDVEQRLEHLTRDLDGTPIVEPLQEPDLVASDG